MPTAQTWTADTGKQSREQALLAGFNELRNQLYGAQFLLLGNHADAQDALQAAFLHCWQARQEIDTVRSLRAWIWTIGMNAARDLRRNAWRRRRRGLDHLPFTTQSSQPTPADAAISNEKLQRLQRALAELRLPEREVFLLRQNGSLTFDEIAAVQHQPVGTVKTQMRRALQKLRQRLYEDNCVPGAPAAIELIDPG
jgi:RNA polymerase sigma-70 factor (ECF subfamily)